MNDKSESPKNTIDKILHDSKSLSVKSKEKDSDKIS